MRFLIALLTLQTCGAIAAERPQPSDPPQSETAPRPEEPHITFESLDKNADQQISKTEAQADPSLNNHFATADTNSDGYLSRAEYDNREKT